MKLKFLYAFILLFSQCLFSQETDVSVNSYNADFSFTPGNIFVGRLKSTLGYVDNFLYSDSNNMSTSFLEIEPSLFIQTQMDRNLFQLLGRTVQYSFTEFSDDNHGDYDLTAKYHFKPSINQRFSATARYQHVYEQRGTGLTQGTGSSISQGDEKDKNFYNIGYYYGHKDSVARVWLLVGRRNFEYTTRREVTKVFDYTGDYLEAGADYLYSGKSYFTGKINYENLNYHFNPVDSRIEKAVLFGFKWFSSVISKSEFLFGLSELEFYEGDAVNKDTFKWEVDLIWNPSEFVEFEFTTARSFEEASQINSDYKVVDNYTLSLKYDFNHYLDFYADLSRNNQEVVFSNKVNIEDYNWLSIKTRYQANGWLYLYINYEFRQLQSSFVSDNFDRNNYSIGVEIKI